MSTFTVRPKEKSSDKDAFLIFLTAPSLLSLKLKAGDMCTIRSAAKDEDGPARSAIAWNPSNSMKDSVVQTSKTLQETYGLKLGDGVIITRSMEILQDANTVVLQALEESFEPEFKAYWEHSASLILPIQNNILVPNQKVTLTVGRQKYDFEVGYVGATIARITQDTVFVIGSPAQKQVLRNIKLDFSSIGGLQTQTEQIQEIVNELVNAEAKKYWNLYPILQGVLLYGPKGVGKTKFQAAISQQGWDLVTQWKPGEKFPKVQGPHLVMVDLVNFQASNVKELVEIFESVKGLPVLILGEARHPNDVPERLRGPSTFSLEMELPIPDAVQRYDILQALRNTSIEPVDDLMKEMAARTHGFVGNDLFLLLSKVWKSAMKGQLSTEANGVEADTQKEVSMLNLNDLDYALTQVRPSALQEIFLEKPNVRWSDIGGQHEIKRQLKNAVERPLKYADRMKRLGLKPKKGVLLYGPPGCSKTLLVKALATEADLNFLAVKGAELISMYVGESERATREVFRKARAASPSIIFFDEIDAIASRSKTGSDLNVLTTLLNEMDGFEELKNVMVVAATNKPQSIDPALMRPGRFDNVVYIGPPDFHTRHEILQSRFEQAVVEEEVKQNIDEYSKQMEGFSGAEIVGICQTAGELALDADRDVITIQDIQEAIKQTPKSITAVMMMEYDMWNTTRMANT